MAERKSRAAGLMACPLCGRPRDPAYRPFCSRECRDRDLLNWLDGVYAVPAAAPEETEDEEGGALSPPGEPSGRE